MRRQRNALFTEAAEIADLIVGAAGDWCVMHGGTVAAKSEGEGLGELFTVRLPRAETGRGAAANHTQQDRITLAGVTVLVVEDDDDTRTMMSRARQAGRSVHDGSIGCDDFGVDLRRRRSCGGLACRILGAEERGNQLSDGLPPSGVNEARSL